jgi:hypothetical protein
MALTNSSSWLLRSCRDLDVCRYSANSAFSFCTSIEKHGREFLIRDGLNLPVPIPGDQIRVELRNLFGDESMVNGFRAVLVGLFVTVGDGAKTH